MLEHGGRLRAAAQRYGIAVADWLDLSTGIAPYGWPLPPIPADAWQRLPEQDDGLEALARDYYGAAALLPVAGSQAAIQALPRLRRPGLRVGVVSPAYAEHALAWRREGHLVQELSEGTVERDIRARQRRDAPRDLRNQMFLRIQNALQELLELRLFRFGFNLKDLLEDTPVFEDPDRKVIEIDIKYAHTGVAQPGDQILAILAQAQPVLCIKSTDEKGNLVAQSLFL